MKQYWRKPFKINCAFAVFAPICVLINHHRVSSYKLSHFARRKILIYAHFFLHFIFLHIFYHIFFLLLYFFFFVSLFNPCLYLFLFIFPLSLSIFSTHVSHSVCLSLPCEEWLRVSFETTLIWGAWKTCRNI